MDRELIVTVEKCTGCSACMNICPTNSITMKRNIEGFEYPMIDIETCISCKLCQETCPSLNLHDSEDRYQIPKTYAAWSKNHQIRIESTSGGVFTELAEAVLQIGGAVCGAKYIEDFQVQHFVVRDRAGLALLRQSKYVQSHIGYVFREIKKLLLEGIKVLFVGAPCEVAGLSGYLKSPYENLILVDFVCRGTNSPKVYEKYLEFIEEKYQSKIKRVWFKNKTYGWNLFSTRIELRNGKIYLKNRYSDYYMRGYLERNLFIRSCCEQCIHKGFPRRGDITLADFWGIGRYDREMDTDEGTSLVFINSNKGMRCFEEVLENLKVKEEKLDYAVTGNGCIYDSVKLNKNRMDFYKSLDEMPFDMAIKPYIQRGKKETINSYKKRIQKILKR